MVDEYPVPMVGQVERHILVRLFAAGAAVGVPDVDHLAVLHQRTEPLTQAVHDLANSQTELLADIVPIRAGGKEGHRLAAAGGQHAAVSEELEPPTFAALKTGRQGAGGDSGVAVVYIRADPHRGVRIQRELRMAWPFPEEMADRHRDDIRSR